MKTALLILLLLCVNAPAANVTLAWDASPGADGYRIYVGGSSGSYTNTVNVSNVLFATLTGLAASTKYYFAATAYDSFGESMFSNEATYTTLPQLTLKVSKRGSSLVLSWLCAVGVTNTLQRSTNLVDWTDYYSFVGSDDSVTVVRVPMVGNRMFWRIKL